jgi:hypothetical protein
VKQVELAVDPEPEARKIFRRLDVHVRRTLAQRPNEDAADTLDVPNFVGSPSDPTVCMTFTEPATATKGSIVFSKPPIAR